MNTDKTNAANAATIDAGFPIESRPLHDALWQKARANALTMTAQGATEFVTVNVKDFEGLGFRLFFIAFPIWNALRPELSWTHYRTLMRVEGEHARDW